MIVQIYSLTAADDVRALVALGVDHIGVALAGDNLPNDVRPEEARQLFALLPPAVLGSALTVSADVAAIAAMAAIAQPAILHIASEMEAIGVEEQRRLRRFLPGIRLMKSIEVGGPETAAQALDAAERFAPVSDVLLLDSGSPDVPGIGAAGQVHDWDISARIVARVGGRVPVILAGGLGPHNVAMAIRHVRPAGVDSFTRTNDAADTRRKDLDLVARFVHEARRAAASHGG
jgi:phosphoribosylanthranilate isomerase